MLRRYTAVPVVVMKTLLPSVIFISVQLFLLVSGTGMPVVAPVHISDTEATASLVSSPYTLYATCNQRPANCPEMYACQNLTACKKRSP